MLDAGNDAREINGIDPAKNRQTHLRHDLRDKQVSVPHVVESD
jgi:hypothetical protein